MRSAPKDYSKLIVGLLVVVVILGIATLYSVHVPASSDDDTPVTFVDQNGEVIGTSQPVTDDGANVAGAAYSASYIKRCRELGGHMMGGGAGHCEISMRR